MNVEKLEQLADELENEALVFDEFDFARYKNDMACGTVGCALGHVAETSPEWEFDDRRNPVLIENKESRHHSHPIEDACEYFDINMSLSILLFTPNTIRAKRILPEEYRDYIDAGVKELSSEATPKQVAENIRTAIKIHNDDN